jgi:hypothetical protein
VVRRVDTSGIITTVATADYPEDLAFDSSGNLFVLNDFGVVKASGNVQVVGGSDQNYGFAGDGTNALNAVFDFARSLVIGSDDRMYISDSFNQRIRVVSNGIINTWVGPGATGDGGQALGALVSKPNGVVYDAAGNLYVSETYQSRIRKITPAGVISTYAGTGQTGFSGDGGQAVNATFSDPWGLAMMADGSLLVADYDNCRIRKIASNGVISTFAGNGSCAGNSGDGGSATSAAIVYPNFVAVDSAGDVFISTYDAVRKVHAGVISTIAGGQGQIVNGGSATDTTLEGAAQVGFDSLGNVYFADTYTHTVRKVATNGLIYTVAGTPYVAGNSSLGGSATGAVLTNPSSLVVEANGDFWVGDVTGRMSKVSNGSIQPMVGTGKLGFNGDGAALSTMIEVATSTVRSGNFLVFADTSSSLVRRVDAAGSGGAPSIAILSASTSEGNSGTKNLTFTVQLSAAAASTVTFDVSTSDGTAAAGSDYIATSLTGLSIAAGQTSTTFNVPISGDSTFEPDESFNVALASVSGATVVNSSAIGTITNDDAAPPSLSINDVTITEGNSLTKLATFTITLSSALSGPVLVDVATANGTATAGSDYVAKSTVGLRVPAGSTSKTFTVTIAGDTVPETDETFTVNLSNASGAAIADAQGVGTISNDDSAPMPSLSVADASMAEGNSGTSTMTFTVSLSTAASFPVSFDATTNDFSANAGFDYVAVALQGQSIPAGQTSKTISVTINGDTEIESGESFALNISNVTGASIADGSAVGTILNDDQAEELPSLSVWASSAMEGNVGSQPMMDFVVTMSSMAVQDVTFSYATADGTATAGQDYVASTGTATIHAGQGSVWISVPVTGDALPESSEDFTLTISDPVNAQIVQATGTGRIDDDDTPPLPTLSISSQVITPEGNSGTTQAVFTLQLSAPAPTDVSYDIATTDNTATSPSDFIAKALVGQVIPAGQTSKTFSVTINGDSAVEFDEVYLVHVDNVSGASMSDNQGIGKIRNDDGVPAVSIGDATVTEGNSGTRFANFTISLSEASSTHVFVDIQTADGTAVAGSDYYSNSPQGFSIPPGSTSVSFSVEILGDLAVESDESFTVTLSNPVNGTIADGVATGTIANDDSAGTPTLSIGDVSISEGNSLSKQATFTVTLSQAASTAVTYNIATANGTAVSGTDYTAKSLTGQSIPAGTLSKTFTVSIKGDTVSEPDETFLVNVTNVAGATLGDGQAVGTITNDDAAATPTLSIADASVSEGNSGTKTLTFAVSLSPAASGTVTYNIATSNGTATSGSDYVASSLTGQTISAGATSKAFVVTINGDTTTEPNETFNVTLSSVSGATLGDGSAVGTITNDDGGSTPTISISDATVAEGNSLSRQASFTITLSAPVASAVTYNIATANGTAVAPGDYTSKSLTGVSIPAGATSKAFTVAVKGDTLVEPNETFTVTLSNVTGATIADGQGTGTITNDDAAALSVARFDARGLVDDIDDGNRAPVLSHGDYAILLLDTTQQLCQRSAAATIVGVQGVENRAVLADLAEAANVACPGKPRYAAVMADGDSRGFLVETGNEVQGKPHVLAASKATALSVLGSGHARPITVLLAGVQTPELAGVVRNAQKLPLVLLGATAATGLLDLNTRPDVDEHIFVNRTLLREFGQSKIEYPLLPVTEQPAPVLQLRQ